MLTLPTRPAAAPVASPGLPPALSRALGAAPGAMQRQQALGQYRHVDVDARVAGASPHQLVQLLFERLLQQLARARAASGPADRAQRLAALGRGIAIVDGLESTLDDRAGGAVAEALHASYRLMAAQLADGSEAALDGAIGAAEGLLDAWKRIAP